MRALFAPVLAVLVLTFASGCALAASGPQTGLPVEAITIDTKAGPHTFKVEVAADDESREIGLMFRKTMAPDAGMLFLYDRSQPVAMWMENTYIPLDMLFIAADGHIVNIRQRAVPHSQENIGSAGPVKAVLELNGGTVSRLDIKVGDKVAGPGLGQ